MDDPSHIHDAAVHIAWGRASAPTSLGPNPRRKIAHDKSEKGDAEQHEDHLAAGRWGGRYDLLHSASGWQLPSTRSKCSAGGSVMLSIVVLQLRRAVKHLAPHSDLGVNQIGLQAFGVDTHAQTRLIWHMYIAIGITLNMIVGDVECQRLGLDRILTNNMIAQPNERL